MEINDEKFDNVRQEAEEFYKGIKQVYCPYFGEQVNFNVKGLDHVKMKRWNKARTRNDQYMRLKLIKLAPKVIRKSNTLQGYSETKEFTRKKINNRWENILTDIFYYEFVAILDNIRVRIIVKQLIDGQKYFWSIIPFWRINKDKSRRVLHYGKPAED